MRPCVLMRECGIAFDEVMVRFDGFDAQSHFKQVISAVNPAGKVPVLVDGDVVVWDTVAIAEYVAERFPDKALWPHDSPRPMDRSQERQPSACGQAQAGSLRLFGGQSMQAQTKRPCARARP